MPTSSNPNDLDFLSSPIMKGVADSIRTKEVAEDRSIVKLLEYLRTTDEIPIEHVYAIRTLYNVYKQHLPLQDRLKDHYDSQNPPIPLYEG
jgi:hypothetical protein